MSEKAIRLGTVALCYVRKSWTRDETDQISPERQRSHIQAVCDANGWTPEWYEDTEGHKSGRPSNPSKQVMDTACAALCR